MRSALLITTILIVVGCASTMTERIVTEARKGLVWEADYTPKEGGDPAALAALHDHLTNELGMFVRYAPASDPELRGAFGRSYTRGNLQRFVRVRNDLSVNGTIEVLAHEAAHHLQPPYLTGSEGDVFAEIVGAHVSHRLGVPNAAETSALWLRQHKAALRMALDLQNEIQYVARLLTPQAYQSVRTP